MQCLGPTPNLIRICEQIIRKIARIRDISAVDAEKSMIGLRICGTGKF